jgi:hypothetical protein
MEDPSRGKVSISAGRYAGLTSPAVPRAIEVCNLTISAPNETVNTK